MQNRTLDVTMELSKNEIVDNINKTCEKYGLPVFLLNMILSNISNEVNNLAQIEFQKNMVSYLEKQKEIEEGENKEKN